MANLNLVINTSNFKPFTYDEMSKPLLLYKQEEEARQKAYLDLLDLASVLEALADSTEDLDVYNQYLSYKDLINKVADSMERNGLTRRNNQVFNLRRLYANTIKPYTELMQKRDELAKEQRLDNKNGTKVYSIDYNTESLSNMKKRDFQTYDTVDGAVVRALSAEAYAPIAKLILLSPETSSILNNQYIKEKIQRGYTLDQVLDYMEGLGLGTAADELRKIKTNIMKALELDARGFNADKLKLIEAYIDSSALNAIGATESNNISDRSYLDPASAYNLEMKKKENAFTYDYDEEGNITGYRQEYLDAVKKQKEAQGVEKKNDETKPKARAPRADETAVLYNGKKYYVLIKKMGRMDKDMYIVIDPETGLLITDRATINGVLQKYQSGITAESDMPTIPPPPGGEQNDSTTQRGGGIKKSNLKKK